MIFKNYICCISKDPIKIDDLLLKDILFLKNDLKDVDMICFSGVHKTGFVYRTFRSSFEGDIPRYYNLKVSGTKPFHTSLDYHRFLFMLRMLKHDGEYLYLGGVP